MAKRKKMDDSELSGLLDGQIADAVSYEESELAAQREKALKYYEGVMDDLPAEKGKSSVVSRDVADTLGWVMPGLMRVFFASDKVADFQPVGTEDEQFAKDATDGINFLFLERCDGYKVGRSAFWDGLLQGNGIIKHWWDASPCYKTETFTGLSDDAFTVLVSDDDVEVLEHTEYADPQATFAAANPINAPGMVAGPLPVDPGAAGAVAAPAGEAGLTGMGGGEVGGITSGLGPVGPSLLHDVKIKRTIRTGALRVEALPPEEFLIERSATALNEDVRFCAHVSFPTRSELVKRGYDKELVYSLPAHEAALDEAAKAARDKLTVWNTEAQVDKSVERVKLYECYVLTDYDGDGVAERRLVVIGDRSGDAGERRILENEEWGDDLPFTDIVPDPVPHRWRGRSLFDEMEDIQRVKTVLMRQTLDNLYLANNPQRAANLTQINNPDELITPSIGGVVDTKGDPNAVIRELAIPFVANHSFTALGYMDEVGNRRVGQVSFGLDPETLQNQTATATQAQQSAATSKVELYARNIAEMGLKRLFKCLLKLVVKHQDQPFWIRRQGKPIQMDPRAWNTDMDVSINVGLGAGSRDRDMMMLQGIAQKQEVIIQMLGPTNPLANLVQYRNTLAKMVEVGGMRSPELYFGEVDEATLQQMAEAQAQQPDPKMLELQAKSEMEAQKLQMSAQIETQKMQQAAEIEKVQAQADIATHQAKIQADAALERERFEFDKQLKMLEFNLKQQEHEANLRFRQAEHEANLRFRTQDQQVAHHFKQQDHALRAQAQQSKGADQ